MGSPTGRRRPVRLAVDGHDAAHALRDQVEAALVAVGAIVAVAGELRVDQTRVLCAEHLVAEAGALHDRGPVVLHEDVGALDQREEHLAAARRPCSRG